MLTDLTLPQASFPAVFCGTVLPDDQTPSRTYLDLELAPFRVIINLLF